MPFIHYLFVDVIKKRKSGLDRYASLVCSSIV